MLPPHLLILQQRSKKNLHQQDFLEAPAAEWGNSLQCQQSKAVVNSVAVINDHAERGVAFIEEYSGRLTQSEEQFQYLYTETSDRQPEEIYQTLKTDTIGQQ